MENVLEYGNELHFYILICFYILFLLVKLKLQ
jgi:hypothetical protein